MVLGIEGFDYCNANQVGRKYTELGFKQGNIDPGRQPIGRPGGGYSYSIFNTAFDFNYRTRIYGSRHTWIVGANLMINNVAPGAPAMLFWRFCSGVENAGGENDHTQLSVGWDTGGHLAFYAGGNGTRFGSPGTLIATTGYALTIGVWAYIEMKITFGAAGRIQVWAEDAIVFDSSTGPSIDIYHPGDIADPDRMSDIFQNFGTIGIAQDDRYVADTLGLVNDDRLGPCRVSAVFPVLDAGVAWSRNSGSSNFSCVDDPGGSGGGADDATTELTGHLGQLDLYIVERPACFGKIVAVAANLCAHGASGASSIDFVYQLTHDIATRANIQAGVAVPAGYQSGVPTPGSTVQTVLNSSPLNGGIWRDGDIRNIIWGMRAQGNVQATQFFLEKLTSLRSQHYDCGGGSYVF